MIDGTSRTLAALGRRVVVLCAFVVPFVAWIRPSQAQPDEAAATLGAEQISDSDSAREAFDRGLDLVRKERFRDAIEAFELAYSLKPHYAVLYNISQIYTRLGEPDRAVLYLERYLEEGGSSIPEEQRAERERQLTQLKLERDAASPQPEPADSESVSLTVQCDMPGVEAWIDGRLHTAALPATLLVPIGTHTLQFRRSGYASDTRELKLEQSPVIATCVPQVLSTAVPKAGVAGVTGAMRRERALVPVPPPGTETPPNTATNRSKRVAAYVTAATGLVLAGTGAGIWVWNQQRVQRWKRNDNELATFRECYPNCSTPVPEDFNTRQTANNDLSDSIERFEIVALSTGIVGLALVGVGGLLGSTSSTDLSLAPGWLRLSHTW